MSTNQIITKDGKSKVDEFNANKDISFVARPCWVGHIEKQK